MRKDRRTYWDPTKPGAAAEAAQQQLDRSGANLAGACEGEQIAELIDLVREVSEGRSGLVQIERAQRLIAEIEQRAKEQR